MTETRAKYEPDVVTAPGETLGELLEERDIYQDAKRDIHYTPTYFINMDSEDGGLEAARRLLHKSDLSDGFTTLYLSDRLDLTVEAHVIKPQCRSLFTPEEIAIAEQRLRDVDYQFA